MTVVETIADPDLLAEAECLSIVENDSRRHGATPVQERYRVEIARRAIEVLREQSRGPRLLAAALRIETRMTRWGALSGAGEWARLAADFEQAFLSRG